MVPCPSLIPAHLFRSRLAVRRPTYVAAVRLGLLALTRRNVVMNAAFPWRIEQIPRVAEPICRIVFRLPHVFWADTRSSAVWIFEMTHSLVDAIIWIAHAIDSDPSECSKLTFKHPPSTQLGLSKILMQSALGIANVFGANRMVRFLGSGRLFNYRGMRTATLHQIIGHVPTQVPYLTFGRQSISPDQAVSEN